VRMAEAVGMAGFVRMAVAVGMVVLAPGVVVVVVPEAVGMVVLVLVPGVLGVAVDGIADGGVGVGVAGAVRVAALRIAGGVGPARVRVSRSGRRACHGARVPGLRLGWRRHEPDYRQSGPVAPARTSCRGSPRGMA